MHAWGRSKDLENNGHIEDNIINWFIVLFTYIHTGAYTGFFPGGGKIQQNITLCARSAHKVIFGAREARAVFYTPPGTFLPPPQRESSVIFPRHFHSKHIGTLSLQSKEKHTFCPTKKQKNIYFDYSIHMI